MDVCSITPPSAPGEINHRFDDGPMPTCHIVTLPVSRDVVRVLGVEKIMRIVGPCPVGIKGYSSNFTLHLKLQGVVVGFSILAHVGRMDKLRIRSPVSGEGN